MNINIITKYLTANTSGYISCDVMWCVWNSSLTEENRTDLCRVQKATLRIIMGRDFTDYKNALDVLNIPELLERINTLEKKHGIKTMQKPKK